MSTRDQRARELMMAALDGEIDVADRQELDRVAASDPSLAEEFQRMTRVKEATRAMAYRQPPDETWDRYWSSVYNRTERKVAWFLVAAGAVLLVAYGLWHAVPELVEGLFGASDVPVAVRAGIVALLTGAILLIASVLREQLSSRRSDGYDKGVSR